MFERFSILQSITDSKYHRMRLDDLFKREIFASKTAAARVVGDGGREMTHLCVYAACMYVSTQTHGASLSAFMTYERESKTSLQLLWWRFSELIQSRRVCLCWMKTKQHSLLYTCAAPNLFDNFSFEFFLVFE